jgi:hypothetical protein
MTESTDRAVGVVSGRRLSRVVARLVAVMVIGVLAACALTACGVAQGKTASALIGRPTLAAGALGGPYTSGSVGAAELVLAQNGIATVADESSTAALVPVKGGTRLRFARAQVQSMALGAANGAGISGSALDFATTTPAGDVPISYLLAAWVSKGTTRSAHAIRTIMGSENWTQAPTIVFPTIALPLFVSDVAAAMPANPTASGTNPQGGTIIHLAGVTNAPCTLVSNFIDTTLASVFKSLALDAPSASPGSSVGRFFVGLWNAAISLAQAAITGLVHAITAPVVAAIGSISAAVAVISEVVSYITPWSVKVTADPTTITAGDSGSFSAAIDSPPGAGYPATVTDCASALGITLPKLGAGGADATWTLAGPPAMTATSATSVTLDEAGSTKIDYSTTASDSGCAAGSSGAEGGSGTLAVKRQAVDDLQTLADSMLTSGLGIAGSTVGSIVHSILDPILGAILGELDSLTRVNGTGTVIINPKSGSADCPTADQPSASAKPGDAAECLIGSWNTTVQSFNTKPLGGAGQVYTFTSTGTGSVDYSGSAPVSNLDGNGSIVYSGTAQWRISDFVSTTATTGTFTFTVTGGSVSANNDGDTSTIPSTGSGKLAWSCDGNSASLVEKVPDDSGDTETWTMQRESH